MMDKIPCSVEILTRNSALTLERCLESVKDFAEIIVLDGNSTDGTLEIARRYGCKIYKQYDTDEPMVVIKDYAEVRDKGLRLATYDWFMYIDSDEYLSPEAVEEIRQIVESPHPPAHAFWQPRKYVFNGKVVECATTYPNKQIRLFHKNYAEGFIKRIHERVKLKEGTKAGVLKGFEYLPVGLLAEMYRRWSRYIKLEEEMIAEESPLKLLRLSFRQALLFFLYSARYLRNLVFCRGVKIPFKYEFIRQGFGAVLSCRLFTRSLMGFLGEKSFWAPLAFTILVTGYSFFGQLGYSVFNADQFFYFPSILRAIHLDALGSDFMAKFSPAAFSFYDELIVGIVRYGGLDIFWTAFLLTVITRFMFFYALYRIARYFTRDTLFSALSLFIFVSGFVVYGTAMRSIADMFLARDLALGFSLLSLSFLFEKRYRTSSLALGLGALLNVGTVVPFAVIFYMITFYEFVASGAKIILSRVISLLLPLLAISALWLYRPEGVSSGLFTALDGVWREILLRRVPNIFVMTWYYPNSSPLYLAVSIYLYFLLWRELPGIFADSEKRRFIRMIFFAPLALTALSVLGGEIFGSAFILQLQLSRSLILWKLFLNLLFVYYAYRHVTENPRDFLYNFSLLGIIAAFIVSEKLMFIFLPVQIVLWAWKSKYAKIVSWTAFIAALPILWYFANLHGTKNFSEYAPIIISIAILSAVVVYLLKERIFGALIPLALVIMLMGAVSHASSFSIYPQGILQNKDFMEACEWVKKNIGQDALFIAEPFSDAGGDLRLVCLRSVLVTKKDGGAGMFNRDFALEWRKRFDLVAEAEKSPGTLKGIVKEYGADYVFADKEISLSYPRVFENTRYIIYALEER